MLRSWGHRSRWGLRYTKTAHSISIHGESTQTRAGARIDSAWGGREVHDSRNLQGIQTCWSGLGAASDVLCTQVRSSLCRVCGLWSRGKNQKGHGDEHSVSR
jgi:hypothetical protein